MTDWLTTQEVVNFNVLKRRDNSFVFNPRAIAHENGLGKKKINRLIQYSLGDILHK